MTATPSASPAVVSATPPLRAPVRRWTPLGLTAVVMLAGLVMVGWLARLLWERAVKDDEARFQALALAMRETLETRLEKYEAGLQSLAEWFALFETPNLGQWGAKLERFNLGIVYGGMTEVGIILYWPNVVQLIPADRFPPHWLKSVPTDPSHGPGNSRLYVERPTPGLELATGDGTGLERDAEAMAACYRVGIASSGVHELGGEGRAAARGFRLYVAAYHRNLAFQEKELLLEPQSEERARKRHDHRGNHLLARVYGDIAVDPFLEHLRGAGTAELNIEWFAGEPSEATRLNAIGTPSFALTEDFQRGHHAQLRFPHYGRAWTLACYPGPAFYAHSERGRAWMVAGLGGTLTLAVAGLVFVQTRGRVRAEALAADLAESRELLRKAAHQRARLSRDLHDGTVQSLYAVGLGLGRTRRRTTDSDLGERLDHALAELEAVAGELRGYLTELDPGVSPAQRPEVALGQLVDRLRQVAGADLEFEVAPGFSAVLPAPLVFDLLQVVREGVGNALRHGQANRIRIGLAQVEGWIRLEVHDDGVGFVPSSTQEGYRGLANLQDRAYAHGGRLDVVSQPGGPTRVQFVVPAG